MTSPSASAIPASTHIIGGPHEHYHTIRDAKSQFTKKGSAVCMSIVYVCDGSVISVMIEEKEQ